MKITVVGAGIVGLATADALVRRGHQVTVLEADRPMGARSAGASRVFRLAHAEPALVEAAHKAQELWEQYSTRAGRPLIGPEGTVVSGPRAHDWARAMAEAGAEHTLGDAPPELLGHAHGPVLTDPHGGALDLAGAGRLLVDAHKSIMRPGRVVDLDELVGDAIVVTAGAGTAELVAPLGIEVPRELCHHVRFSFRPAVPITAIPPTHLDGTPGPELASTYQHRTPEGHWAIGGHLPDQLTSVDHTADEVRRRSYEAITAHVVARIPELEPEPVGELHCLPTAGGADGVHTARVGNVHVLWGENLAKLAPLLGENLADAVESDGVAHAIGTPPDLADHGR
ncbi:FAD-dependent oxidoreductase [Actinomycetospora endophytica]|uniref:FAD-dependent oxidoreductase n=1 Tax=Actinomycetospora endophytica TaxID=2291215 RepID=A0ABS8PHJ2_9PSEU|nr:FAD-dependent oxidoreductase [Actinomycetospora endophytica]MCD2197746.1 FAD-dependent oxidoreductase [Actinomycetospora endophytica]